VVVVVVVVVVVAEEVDEDADVVEVVDEDAEVVEVVDENTEVVVEDLFSVEVGLVVEEISAKVVSGKPVVGIV
jgi:hypothetical protein